MSVETAPATGAVAVTPSDSTVLACRALYVGGGGNVAVELGGTATSPRSGTTITFTNVPSGTILPVSCYRVMAATTATSIVALY